MNRKTTFFSQLSVIGLLLLVPACETIPKLSFPYSDHLVIRGAPPSQRFVFTVWELPEKLDPKFHSYDALQELFERHPEKFLVKDSFDMPLTQKVSKVSYDETKDLRFDSKYIASRQVAKGYAKMSDYPPDLVGLKFEGELRTRAIGEARDTHDWLKLLYTIRFNYSRRVLIGWSDEGHPDSWVSGVLCTLSISLDDDGTGFHAMTTPPGPPYYYFTLQLKPASHEKRGD